MRTIVEDGKASWSRRVRTTEPDAHRAEEADQAVDRTDAEQRDDLGEHRLQPLRGGQERARDRLVPVLRADLEDADREEQEVADSRCRRRRRCWRSGSRRRSGASGATRSGLVAVRRNPKSAAKAAPARKMPIAIPHQSRVVKNLRNSLRIAGITGSPLPGRPRRPARREHRPDGLVAVGALGQLEEQRLEVGTTGLEPVDRQAGPQGDVADEPQVGGVREERAVGARGARDVGDAQGAGEPCGVGRPDDRAGRAVELGHGAGPHEAPVGDDDDLVDGLLHLLEEVARHEDRLALAAQVAQEPAQPADALGVQAVRRLVEDEHAGVAEQRGREAESLAHAHAVLAGALAGGGGDAGQLEQLVDPRQRDRAGVRQDAQVVAAAAARVEVRGLQRGPHGAERVGEVDVALAVDRRGAARGVDQPEQHAQRRGLAGAVGPEEAGDPAGLDVEAQVVDGDEGPEALAQPPDLDPRPVAWSCSCGASWCHAPILAASPGVGVNPPVDPAPPRGGPADAGIAVRVSAARPRTGAGAAVRWTACTSEPAAP